MLLPDGSKLDKARGITLTALVEPRGKGRPRLGKGGKTHTDEKTVDWKKRFLSATLVARMRLRPMAARFRGEPLFVAIVLGYPRAKSNKSWWCNVKIDNDNAEKNVWDALQDQTARELVGNRVVRAVNEGLIRDDHEIVSNACMKQWAEKPYIEIHITPIVKE